MLNNFFRILQSLLSVIVVWLTVFHIIHIFNYLSMLVKLLFYIYIHTYKIKFLDVGSFLSPRIFEILRATTNLLQFYKKEFFNAENELFSVFEMSKKNYVNWLFSPCKGFQVEYQWISSQLWCLSKTWLQYNWCRRKPLLTYSGCTLFLWKCVVFQFHTCQLIKVQSTCGW